MTCQCARVVHLVSIVARYARRETDDGCATRSRSRVGVNRVKLPRARAIAKEAEATDSETQLVVRFSLYRTDGGAFSGRERISGRRSLPAQGRDG